MNLIASSSRPSSDKTRKRRWRIPPPPLHDGRSPGVEGLSVLIENKSQLGAVLWKSLRSVLLWADTDFGDRRKLFDSQAAQKRQGEILTAAANGEPGPRKSLEDLLSVLARPTETEAEFVGRACTEVASWAESRQARLTRLEYLQAAAMCCPGDAKFALAVGSALRDLAQYDKAEAWLHRAVGLARQAGQWKEYVTAYLAHGVMMYRRGALPAARRSYLKAMRRSRRQGLRDGEARARHNLFNLEYRAGAPAKAVEHAVRASELYGPRDRRFPRLVHDIAYVWLEQGDYKHSYPIFVETLRKVGPSDRAAVLGSLSRAAAGLGDLAAYEWSLAELRGYAPAVGVADAWVDMAQAALTLDRHEEAEEAAQLAESVARARREGQVRFLAEKVMERVKREREARRTSAGRGAGASDAVARDLIRSLQLAPTPRVAHLGS